MRRPSRAELLFATLAGIVGVAGSYAVTGFSRSFVAVPIDTLIVWLTPGGIVAFMIQNVGEVGHLLHIAMAVGIAVGLFAAASLAGIVAARELDQPVGGVVVAGLVATVLSVVIIGDPIVAASGGLPVALLTALGVSSTATETATEANAGELDHDPSRRRVVAAGVGTLAAGALGFSIGSIRSGAFGFGDDAERPIEDVDGPVGDRLQQATDQSLDIQGDVPGLVSTFEEFYNVDIATVDPEIAAETWSLSFTGEVGANVEVTYDELTDMPTEHRYITLRCVGEGLNGKKMDTAVWTGTPIKPLLEEVDPEGECGCAMLRAEDDYFVQFPIEALEDGFLAWEMNGQPLPTSHGQPVRILIPGHWGETNVKWLEEIELLEEEMDGYWEQRGWHGTGPVNTVAKLWSTTELDSGRMELAGHAYAGTRGIERVEVSTDGGESWTDADLSEPLPGDDVWRQWRYEFQPSGSHDVVVRAVDGEGTLQPEDRSESFPSGATGWVRQTV
jgi:DMSO/TMAO reductase YedYZ molybdopterin-dependent catalytic subunit